MSTTIQTVAETSPTAFNYEGKDNHGKPKREYLEHIAQMTTEELFKETKERIWLSAYANNNPRSDYHWQCDATYDEWQRRGDDKSYAAAHKQVCRENGQ